MTEIKMHLSNEALYDRNKISIINDIPINNVIDFVLNILKDDIIKNKIDWTSIVITQVGSTGATNPTTLILNDDSIALLNTVKAQIKEQFNLTKEAHNRFAIRLILKYAMWYGI